MYGTTSRWDDGQPAVHASQCLGAGRSGPVGPDDDKVLGPVYHMGCARGVHHPAPSTRMCASQSGSHSLVWHRVARMAIVGRGSCPDGSQGVRRDWGPGHPHAGSAAWDGAHAATAPAPRGAAPQEGGAEPTGAWEWAGGIPHAAYYRKSCCTLPPPRGAWPHWAPPPPPPRTAAVQTCVRV